MKDAKKWASGFTIVELIVVIVVIGILVGIVMVSYTAVVNNAHLQQVNGDAETAASTLFRYKADNGAYPSSLSSVTIPNTQSTYQYSFNATNDTYCLTATYGSLSVYIQNGTNTPTPGACPGHGVNGVAPITNLAINPSLELNNTNWYSRWCGSGSPACSGSSTSAAAFYGGQGWRKTWTAGGGGQDIGMQYNMNVTPGMTYAFSAAVRGSVATGQKAFIQWLDSSNATISYSWGNEVAVPANTWQRVSVVGTAPSNASVGAFVWGPYPGSGSPATSAGETMDFDGVMITQGSTVYNYADGDSHNWVWNGTPHASTSTGPQL